MEILISPYLLAKFFEGISKGLDEKKESKSAEQDPDGFVSIHAYDMLAQAYDAKWDECNKLKAENRKLTEQLSKYRYFIECQKNEIEKL
ncbi:MAG: hypothetical protein NC410_09205 [Oscillibacter sp.]|nr:hypothetical protein [Oscillibacter sp.]